MKIGEFANYCGTKVSVLRHYDKEKLLVPERIDVFTGYRYYSELQKAIFDRITALKNAGFTLHEIKRIISFSAKENEIAEMFARKADELSIAMQFLKEAEYIMSELNVIFENDMAKVRVKQGDDKFKLCCQLDSYIKNADCQRISQFFVAENEISCAVIKLGEETDCEDPILPFIDDSQVIGKWEVVGNYAVREDFEEDLFSTMSFYGEDVKYIYFLPNGTKYWCFCWTKGYFVVDGYRINPIYNPYEIVKNDADVYMLISLRENEASRGGHPTILALRQVDNHEYTPEMIARKDNINLPFVNDERIIGKWTAHSFLGNKSEFPLPQEDIEDLYFKEIEFFPEGRCRCVYEDDIFEGTDTISWTKNYLLRKWNWSACEYEIREYKGTQYMIIEWKSGDYRFGGFDTNYYVFVRA